MRTNTTFLALILAFGVPGCSDEADSTPIEGAELSDPGVLEAPLEPEVEPEVEAPAAGPRAEEESYTLEARPEEGGYTAGTLGQFAIHLEGRGEWHLNQDFPFSVELEAPDGVTLPKATLSKGDAAEFGDESARVDVPFTPTTAGAHTVTARVYFAVCNPQSCVPKTATLALNLAVN